MWIFGCRDSTRLHHMSGGLIDCTKTSVFQLLPWWEESYNPQMHTHVVSTTVTIGFSYEWMLWLSQKKGIMDIVGSTLRRFFLSCLLDPFVLLFPKLYLFGFPIFRFWAYLMMVILSVPDEGYFERTWWWLFWAYLMMVILSVPDDGYFERTWWWLFWAYLMKVILSVPDEGYSRHTSCALNLISTFLFCYCIKRYLILKIK